jgi:hypothetical protein
MGIEKIGMKAVKFTGSRTRWEGAKEMLDLCSNAVPQNDVVLIWSKGQASPSHPPSGYGCR